MAANSKNVLPPFHVVNAQSMTSSLTSAPTNTQFLDNIMYQAQWSGTPTGTFAIQGSLDYSVGSGGTLLNAGTWDAIPMSATISAAGSADSGQFDLNQIPYPWLRLAYTASSGTGTLDVYVTGKAI